MRRLFFFLGIMLAMILNSCKTREQVVYMQDVPQADSMFVVRAAQNIHIRQGDKLSIVVNTSIPEMSTTFNLAIPYHFVGGQGTTSSQLQTAFYTVDENGEIDFPILGKIRVAGMTRTQIGDDIKTRLIGQNLLKDAVVSVEFGNLTFSVLGEVNAPGRYSFDKDHINILEAISMAKDLTINGRRDNVLLTRTDEQGHQHTYRVDLRNTKSLYGSAIYNVQQNDIIYVEPNTNKVRQSSLAGNTIQNPSFWISVASLLTTITALIIR